MPEFKNEIEIIIDKINLIKSTWEMCHNQHGMVIKLLHFYCTFKASSTVFKDSLVSFMLLQ